MEPFESDLARLRALRMRGEYRPAQAVAGALLAGGWGAPAEALVRNECGLIWKALGEYRRARGEYERAMRLVAGRAATEDRDDVATLLHNLAGIRFVLGDPAGAARCGRRGLAMRRRLWGPDDLAVLLDEGNLAPILVALGDHDGAQRLLDRLLVRFTALGAPAEFDLAVTLTNLGGLAARRGDWTQARDTLARAASVKERRSGPDSPELITTLANLAVAHDRLGAAETAGEVRARARRIARATLPPSHPLRRHVERSGSS